MVEQSSLDPDRTSYFLSPAAAEDTTTTRQRSNASRATRRSSASTSSDDERRPSIRIRRSPSTQSILSPLDPENAYSSDNRNLSVDGNYGNRPRSRSDPLRRLSTGRPRSQIRSSHMPFVPEEVSASGGLTVPQDAVVPSSTSPGGGPTPNLNRLPTINVSDSALPEEEREEYESGLVDLLDIVDPEVSTLSTLTNVQNSLFVPDLGRFLNRRPTYTLTPHPSEMILPSSAAVGQDVPVEGEDDILPAVERVNTFSSITSIPSNSHYAVLPHGVTLEGWSAEDRQELNDHVRHMLHSRRSKFKRSMRGFGQYIKKPLGFFVTLYATLITLFGLAWVLFLIGWINVKGRRSYLINVIDNVLVALFAIVGDGLAPFRAVDTYHMIFIAHYHRLSWRLRKEQALPKLEDKNDLPSRQPTTDLEADKNGEISVLSPKQQERLVYHQNKFSKSHTFYKPHETTTHHAFPLALLIIIVVLLDCHSLLQISLGTCTWAISYHHRPFALTTIILCCSITVNITAGIIISVGDHKTRKKDVLERMSRQELTAEAMSKVEKKKEKESKRNSLDISRSSSSGHKLRSAEAPSKLEKKKEESKKDSLDVSRSSSGNKLRTTEAGSKSEKKKEESRKDSLDISRSSSGNKLKKPVRTH